MDDLEKICDKLENCSKEENCNKNERGIDMKNILH